MASSFPIITVPDLAAVLAFYEHLGYQQTYRYPTDGDPVFVTVERHGATVGIGAGAADDPPWSYWIDVDDVDATVASLRAFGAAVVAEPEDQPWGERIARLRDPAGNLVVLGAPIGDDVAGGADEAADGSRPSAVRSQPMLVVDDVEAVSAWFCDVFGLTSGHGGPEYEMLMSGSEVVAQLHRWDTHGHPHLGNPDDPSRGNGVLVWFAVDDVDGIIQRARRTGTVVVDGPSRNPNSGLREVWLRGPDGYLVVASGA